MYSARPWPRRHSPDGSVEDTLGLFLHAADDVAASAEVVENLQDVFLRAAEDIVVTAEFIEDFLGFPVAAEAPDASLESLAHEQAADAASDGPASGRKAGTDPWAIVLLWSVGGLRTPWRTEAWLVVIALLRAAQLLVSRRTVPRLAVAWLIVAWLPESWLAVLLLDRAWLRGAWLRVSRLTVPWLATAWLNEAWRREAWLTAALLHKPWLDGAWLRVARRSANPQWHEPWLLVALLLVLGRRWAWPGTGGLI